MNRFFQLALRRTSGFRIHALVALFLFGYLASFSHDVSVRHTICEAHGDWMHDAAATSEADAALDPSDGTPQLRSMPLHADDLHEHCGLVVVSRSARGPAPSSPLVICAPLIDSVHLLVHYATPARKVLDRSTPARGPPTNV